MISQTTHERIRALSKQFHSFAKQVYHNSSPLYEQLSSNISEDHEVLSLASYSRKGEVVPNLLLGAVHYLLLKEMRHPLADFYPSIVGAPKRCEDSYPFFRSFCLDRANEIRGLISSRLVQTNEVQRCACIPPALPLISDQTQGQSLSWVDVGASAGLNLMWDQFAYEYGGGVLYGESSSPVYINCPFKGELRPTLPDMFPPVPFRVGIDLEPIDVADPDARLWLRALVWPEHAKRAELLGKAVQLALEHRPRVTRGDALDVLPRVLSDLRKETVVCVFHSITLYKWSPESCNRFWGMLTERSKGRSLFEISFEWWKGKDQPELSLASYENGVKNEKLLAYSNPHVEWMEWIYQQ